MLPAPAKVLGGSGAARVTCLNAPARLLWLTKGLGRGGAEQLLVSTLAHLDRHRFEVEVAYLLPWKDSLVAPIADRGVTVHCLGSSGSLDLSWVLRLRRLLSRGDFDLVHTHAPYPALGARLVVARGIPIVHTEHNLWPRYHPLTRWLNALSHGRNTRVVAVSLAVKDSIRPLRSLRHPPVETIVHGIDSTSVRRGVAASAHGRTLLGLEPDEVVVGTVANFTAKKDQQTLLRAFAQVAGEHKHARLVLVGTGPLEQSLHKAADDLGIARQVTFAGSRGDVPEILPGFDVFALSSRHEGLPIALIEAMAAGLPSVATAVGGVPEALADGRSGFLVPPSEPALFATALTTLIEDSALRVRMGAAATVDARAFSIEPAVRRLEEIYDRVLDRA